MNEFGHWTKEIATTCRDIWYKVAKKLDDKHPDSDVLLKDIKIGDILALPVFDTSDLARVKIEKVEIRDLSDKYRAPQGLVINDKIIIAPLIWGDLHISNKLIFLDNDGNRILFPNYYGFYQEDIDRDLVLYALGDFLNPEIHDSNEQELHVSPFTVIIKAEGNLFSEMHVRSLLGDDRESL